MVRELHGPDHQIATLWHPEPVGELLDTLHGNIRVLKGELRYQLSNGEIRKL